MRRAKIPVGELLQIIRDCKGNRKVLNKKYPSVLDEVLRMVATRTDLFTSHNRTVRGKNAPRRTKRLVSRNKEIVRLARLKKGGKAKYTHGAIAVMFDIDAVTVSKICLAAKLRRRKTSRRKNA